MQRLSARVASWLRRRTQSLSFGLAALGVSSAAFGAESWQDEARLAVKVHEHVFHRVVVAAVDCQLQVRLHFDAPKAGYAEPVPERNHYRFIARVKVAGGKRFVSPILSNAQPGARVISFAHDSTGEGCWAGKRRKLRKVDVHACRGTNCTPKGF